MKPFIWGWFCVLIFMGSSAVHGSPEFERLMKMDDAGWHESPENWRFGAFLDDRVPGGRIVCAIKNISQVDRMLVIVGVEGRFEFLWKGAAPEVKEKKNWKRSSGARGRSLELVKPGEQLRDSFLLKDYFILIPGQRYVFRLKHYLEEYPARGKERVGIISNPVEFMAK
jgi:hypothetical protein